MQIETQQRLHDPQMRGRTDRQKFRQPFDDAEKNGKKKIVHNKKVEGLEGQNPCSQLIARRNMRRSTGVPPVGPTGILPVVFSLTGRGDREAFSTFLTPVGSELPPVSTSASSRSHILNERSPPECYRKP